MRITVIYCMLFTLCFSCSGIFPRNQENETSDLLETSAIQLEKLHEKIVDSLHSLHPFPIHLTAEDDYIFADAGNSFSGYYPGILWMMYELSGEESWRIKAEEYTTLLSIPKDQHGYMAYAYFAAFANGYRLTGDETCREKLIESARRLISGFYLPAGLLGDFKFTETDTVFYVSPFHMMDLEMLFYVSAETGEPVFANIAVKHAQSFMQKYFSGIFPDSTLFNSETNGRSAIKIVTEDAGRNTRLKNLYLATALYGYTQVYKKTGESSFLKMAEQIAHFFTEQTSAVHPDNFKESKSTTDKDLTTTGITAMAIATDALCQLASFSEDSDRYSKAAGVYFDQLVACNVLDSGKNLENSGVAFNSENLSGLFIRTPSVISSYFFMKALKGKFLNDQQNHLSQNKMATK